MENKAAGLAAPAPDEGLSFFRKPILNNPYSYPNRYWELDSDGRPTNSVIGTRRPAKFVTPIPKAKKARAINDDSQQDLGLIGEYGDEYDLTSIINEVRANLNRWRVLPENEWHVTPETDAVTRLFL